MRVLLANKFFFRNGGSEAVMFAERDFLRETSVDVVDFSMRSPRNEPSAYEDDFVRAQDYGDEPGGALKRLVTAARLVHSREAVRRIGRLIDRTRPDLVHCHNIYHQLTPSIIGAAKRRGVPVVLTLHDYKPVCPVYTRLRDGVPCSECLGGATLPVLRHRCAEGSVVRSAILYAEAVTQKLLGSYERLDAVIAPSEFMKESVTRSRFSPARVHVIPNAIDTHLIRPASGDRGYALFLGRLSVEKGIETLLQAHENVADRLDLWVAGAGPLEATLRQRYPHARFLGHVAGDELARVIGEAAFVVVPSEWYENCPMSVLEAMAHGKAVIASDIGGIPELVRPGESGILFPPGDRTALTEALLALLEDRFKRLRLGSAGRERAEQHFSPERHNLALMRLYLSVVERDGESEEIGLPDHP